MNARITIACATRILQRRNSNLFAVNDGHALLNKWACYILHNLGYAKQKSNSKAEVILHS